MNEIKGFHAHVYYNQATYEQAKKLCVTAMNILPVSMGYMHTQAVGPHPYWSCQLSFTFDNFANVFSWLCLNRNGLTIFSHPVTHNHYKDHTNHAIWMGDKVDLNLSMFKPA